jgi:hypothetical protein
LKDLTPPCGTLLKVMTDPAAGASPAGAGLSGRVRRTLNPSSRDLLVSSHGRAACLCGHAAGQDSTGTHGRVGSVTAPANVLLSDADAGRPARC